MFNLNHVLLSQIVQYLKETSTSNKNHIEKEKYHSRIFIID